METLLAHKDPSQTFEALRGIIEEAEGLVGFPLAPLEQMITVLGNQIADNDSFNELLDTVVEASSKRDGEVRAARLLLKRGMQFMEMKKPARAIAMIGRALSRLYKHETRGEIVYALYLCGHAYERIGLVWAARGAYLSGSSIAANDFWAYGEINYGFIQCVDRLRWMELRLGRLPQLMAWHELGAVLKDAEARESGSPNSLDENDMSFDSLLARLLLRTSAEDLSSLAALPDALERMKLPISSDSLAFILGYPERLAEFLAPTETVDEFASKIWHIKSDMALAETPSLYQTEQIQISSKVLGCTISIESSTNPPCVEIGESILGAVESLLSTAVLHGAVSWEPSVMIQVSQNSEIDSELVIEEKYILGKPHIAVSCQPINPYDATIDTQTEIREQVFKVALAVLSHCIQFPEMEKGLNMLFQDERASERAAAFTGPVGTIRNTLGKEPKFRISSWQQLGVQQYPNIRSSAWVPSPIETARTPKETMSPPHDLYAHENAKPNPYDPDIISHQEMKTVSLIRQNLWNQAGWAGAFFMWDDTEQDIPILGLMFKDANVGREIFEGWISELGKVDVKEALRITIIRGIDKAKPHSYRMLIGSHIDSTESDRRLLMMVHRVHRMDPSSSRNLDNFAKHYAIHQHFWFIPGLFDEQNPEPHLDMAIGIEKIHIRHAWEIGPNDPDSVGIVPEENPIIPDDVPDPPINRLIEARQGRENQ